MPIYEYNCCDCGKHFEELLRSAGADVACAHCGSHDVKRAISIFGFASKGSSGEVTRSSASGGGCSGCKSHNCGNCH